MRIYRVKRKSVFPAVFLLAFFMSVGSVFSETSTFHIEYGEAGGRDEMIEILLELSARSIYIEAEKDFSGVSSFCFDPYNIYAPTAMERLLPGYSYELNVETESNDWIFVLVSELSNSARVFSISQSDILWNDYGSVDPHRITDEHARATCKDRFRIYYDSTLDAMVLSIGGIQ